MDGGGRPRALVAGERWGGRRGWMAVLKKGEVGAWLAVPKRGKSRQSWLAWQFHRRGQGLGGESKGFGSGRVGVLFFESWRVDVMCSRRARAGPRASVLGG